MRVQRQLDGANFEFNVPAVAGAPAPAAPQAHEMLFAGTSYAAVESGRATGVVLGPV